MLSSLTNNSVGTASEMDWLLPLDSSVWNSLPFTRMVSL